MEYIARNIHQQPMPVENSQSFEDSLTTSTCPDIPIYGASYQNSYTTSDNTVPPEDQCTNEEAIKRRLK